MLKCKHYSRLACFVGVLSCYTPAVTGEPATIQNLLNEGSLRSIDESQQAAQPTVHSVYTQDENETAPLCASDEQLQSALKPLAKISLQIAPTGDKLPPCCFGDAKVGLNERFYCTHGARSPARFYMHWLPSELAHNPAYFQDVALARYGQGRSPCVQPFVSGAKFIGTAFSLPYRMGVDHPHDLVYTLGYERPGNYAPCVYQQLPWNKKAAILQAGAIVTGAFLYP